jgi:antitoxin component of MazEF toxin-antitoxin module
MVIEPVNQRVSKYTLDELLAGELEPSEEISWGKSAGEEIW